MSFRRWLALSPLGTVYRTRFWRRLWGAHAFVVGDTCYWHHEWERCALCGVLDRPDEPNHRKHIHHSDDADRERQEQHPEHAAHVAMKEGRPVEWKAGVGWVVKSR